MITSQLALTVISTLSLILNSITLYVTGYSLRFDGIDVVFLSLVAIFDLIGSLINITRTAALDLNWFVNIQSQKIWCIFDSTLGLTLSQTTYEIIAMLSVLRYLKICHNRQQRLVFWIKLLVLSSLTSFGFNLGNSFYSDVYIWKALTCFPTTKKDAANMIYFVIWDILSVVRVSVSLFIICFCYYDVAMMCQKILKEKIKAFELDQVQPSDRIQFRSVHSFDIILKNSSKLRGQIKLLKKLKIIHIQLSLIIIAYILSLGSVIFIIMYNLTLNDPLPVFTQESLELLSWTILIINPLFLLVSHKPSHRELMNLKSKLFKSKSPTDTSKISIQ